MKIKEDHTVLKIAYHCSSLRLGQRFGLCLLGGGAAGGCILHLLDDSLVGLSCLHRQLARQQEIAGVTVGNFDQIAAVAQIHYIVLQNDFHDLFSSSMCG